jgi:hypothetical protein
MSERESLARLIEAIDEWFQNNEVMSKEDYDNLMMKHLVE